ncbi:hypothetical protein DSL64_15305 [Dyadobacter luteus]|jgi:hypothetical protein|uniref:Uncharacterized protein n=1 Tax=Dyadobacter luteus TaxID=2259619 RepID=A0A3D8YA40_9BACT|nr:hypothetical protein [Dyadobacter luteus]REA60474.1 hypothetical protein DSL64_15305 [Dyadobacter luteus]
MRTIKLFTLLILFSLQAGATGFSHNMFVAHKKLQAGKEKNIVCDQVQASKPEKAVVHTKAAVKAKKEVSFTQQIGNKLSGMVTLNQRVVEQGPSALFASDEEEETQSSIVSKLIGLVKGAVFSFLSSISFN